MYIYLGGTWSNSNWRNRLIKRLDPSIRYFDPIVPEWTPEQQKLEIRARQECSHVLYVITPLMTGVYSIAELVEDACTRDNVIACFLKGDKNIAFTESQWKSLMAVKRLVEGHGCKSFTSLDELVEYLNNVNRKEVENRESIHAKKR